MAQEPGWTFRWTGPGAGLWSGYSVGPFAAELIPRASAAAVLTMMALTYTLWLPETYFPQVPWLASVAHWPASLEGLAAALTVVGLVGTLLSTGPLLQRLFLALWLFAGLVLVLFDQQRLQPWFYLGGLIALAWLVFPTARAGAWLRLLLVSLYFWSAVGKLDVSFVHEMAPLFLNGLAWGLGFLPRGTLAAWPNWLVWSLPIGELLVALVLLVPRLRWLGIALALTLHGLLLVILGPWGLGHSPAVWVWNALFLILVPAAFGARSQQATLEPASEALTPASEPRGRSRRAEWAASVVLGGAVVLPALEPWGGFDVWPSWGLYAAGNARVELYLHREDLARLPPRLSEPSWMPPVWAREEWVRVRTDRWSLNDLAAPVYPSVRFGLGVADDLASRYPLRHGPRVVIVHRADRWTGLREREILQGYDALNTATREFWFNARGRMALRGGAVGGADR